MALNVSLSHSTIPALFVVALIAMLLPASSIASIMVTLWVAVRTGKCGIHIVELIDDPWIATSGGFDGSPA
ncbi:hypothetical protein H7J88_03225 [Mycolicibacterium flavescens]|uniref:Uncharacterized protein n=1 Tax=Mycolicibacterium flavescens TaxID=1776 RepID=A0A1E3RBL2_MYCFV|nr:hypothetical protein [Mycolicibacterium flavescens]MCV7278660.1 hypothetical protein [Mycolicibacterium flavescens]ODQ87295.1 hypothetical protein BHQ18_24295 [Mycolicibacterium flavescens]